MTSLGDVMVTRGGSLNPSAFPGEEFDLYSIPAHDRGGPEVALGSEIGSSKQIVQPGDVMISKIIPHIRRARVVGPLQGRRQVASGEWIVFRGKDFAADYLRHFLLSDGFHGQFMNTVAGVGGSLVRARPAQVRAIELPLPPLPEQRRIAAILDHADALRAKRRQVLARLDRLRASVASDALAKESTGSAQTALGDIADVLTGFAFPSAKFVNNGIRLCRGANVLPGRLDWSDLRCWSTEDMSGLDRFALTEGDIVLALDRPWIAEGQKMARVSRGDLPLLLVQRVARIRATSDGLQELIWAALASPDFQRYCRPTETTIPHISPVELRNYPIAVPSAAVLSHLRSITSALEVQRTMVTGHLTEIDHLFVSLQSRAFRGEL